jgi:hypothetical protein
MRHVTPPTRREGIATLGENPEFQKIVGIGQDGYHYIGPVGAGSPVAA